MLQTVRCIRFADVLMDEQKNLFIFCSNCHTDFTELSKFHYHLTNCNGLDALVAPDAKLSYETNCYEHKMAKSENFAIKEYLIYNINAVHAQLPVFDESTIDNNDDLVFDLDAELLDPRWYNDFVASNQQHAAPTPPLEKRNKNTNKSSNGFASSDVQFKENVKTYFNTSKGRSQRKTSNIENPPIRKQVSNPTLVKLATTSVVQTPAKVKSTETNKTNKMKRSLQTEINNSTQKIRKTEEILNKLQNLGLEVKRTSTTLSTKPPDPQDVVKNQATLELVKKLQSKGIQLSVINTKAHEAKGSKLEENFLVPTIKTYNWPHK